MVASTLIAQGGRRPVTSQRDERLERTAASRMVTISSALAKYENALQAARSLWLASDSVGRRAVPGRRLPPRRAPVHDPTTGVELHDERVGPGSLVASEPEGFRAGGPDVRETRFTSGERTFVLRYAPLAGNPILTERTIPASLLLGAGVGVSVLLGALLWLLAQVGSLYREVGRLARTDKGTCSIGVATWDRREEATALVARADRALYAAKKGGRNRSCADPAEAAEPVARAQG
jgi:Diguanylate cyclase, GGDEF domain